MAVNVHKLLRWGAIALTGAAIVAANIAVAEAPDPDAASDPSALVESWPERSRVQAQAMIERYGEPDEATPRRLIWHHEWPWKRIEVHSDEIVHDFPRPHGDVLEVVIDYRVPLDRIEDLARFHGSLTVARTAGELAVRCEDERLAFLAINLAHEIATGAKAVDAARREYTDTLVSLLRKEDGPTSTRKILFAVGEETADPDVYMKMRL